MYLLSCQHPRGGEKIMSDHCGSVTEDGAAVCIPGACSCSTEAESSESINLSINKNQEQTMWQKIRSGVMFGVACITSPCCTPLIVPLSLSLLAGAPIALWLSTHIGLVYGALTLLSIVSLVLGLRWMSQKTEDKGKITVQPFHESNPSLEISK